MPGIAMDVPNGEALVDEANEKHNPQKENYIQQISPRSPLGQQTPHSDSLDYAINGAFDTSIEQLYHNVCEMQSSVQSPSRASLGSYSEESRIDSELRHLVGDIGEMELTKDVVTEIKEEGRGSDSTIEEKHVLDSKKSIKTEKNKSGDSRQSLRVHIESESSARSSPKSKSYQRIGKRNEKNHMKPNAAFSMKKLANIASSPGAKAHDGIGDPLRLGLDSPDLGPYLLKQTRDMLSAGEKPQKALELARRAVKSFELGAEGKPNLHFVMSLHVLAAIYCRLGQYSEAIPVLERSIEIPVIEDGQEYALAKFSGCMQLGDTYAIMGQIENSILCYTAGLEIQKQALGETDHRIGETCRYLAEAHVQALQFDEAEKLCQMALDIHRANNPPASFDEAADRRLMGLICDSKGDHEAALEHYVLASMALASNGQDVDVASIDRSIGDAYLSLARFDEAILSFQKAVTAFKSAKGEQHPTVASVYVRLAELYNKIGKFRESKSYCENALRIYSKPNPGVPPEEIASGLIDVAAIYQSMDELEQAIKLLKKALRIYGDAPGQQGTIAGLEAQMGVIYYMMGNYSNSYNTLKSAISKFRASGEKKSALFGIALNQMGLACVQCYAINEAADLFEEARSIMEKECGPEHPDTLGVCSNLAGTYDAMGRLDDAIEILEYVVGMREEKLGTANPDVEDEKQRLAELLKEAGKVRSKKSRPLESLLDNYITIAKENSIEVS